MCLYFLRASSNYFAVEGDGFIGLAFFLLFLLHALTAEHLTPLLRLLLYVSCFPLFLQWAFSERTISFWTSFALLMSSLVILHPYWRPLFYINSAATGRIFTSISPQNDLAFTLSPNSFDLVDNLRQVAGSFLLGNSFLEWGLCVSLFYGRLIGERIRSMSRH